MFSDTLSSSSWRVATLFFILSSSILIILYYIFI
nr:MAG TPA: hypothetical protein [Caudoviricetes sp.]DAI40713.1 MAG TPA: hypothetical protein [Caudoviricetes sp.]DAK15482.1 MAG TPA: hypothetical protein [Caudoviricetes sp.]